MEHSIPNHYVLFSQFSIQIFMRAAQSRTLILIFDDWIALIQHKNELPSPCYLFSSSKQVNRICIFIYIQYIIIERLKKSRIIKAWLRLTRWEYWARNVWARYDVMKLLKFLLQSSFLWFSWCHYQHHIAAQMKYAKTYFWSKVKPNIKYFLNPSSELALYSISFNIPRRFRYFHFQLLL